ncbi:hypothetical protein [Streptomyces phaeoluteigriseus]
MTIADDEQRGGTAGPAGAPQVPELPENTDWGSLAHAYGPAGDVPPHLVHLLDEDPRRQAEALGMLDMSVLPQGSLYSATPPAVLFVAGVRPTTTPAGSTSPTATPGSAGPDSPNGARTCAGCSTGHRRPGNGPRGPDGGVRRSARGRP